MTELAKGTFKAPVFTEDDLLQIEARIVDAVPSPWKEDLIALARHIRAAEKMEINQWLETRQRARELGDEDQQLKTDLYRLLKEVDHA